MDKQFDRITKVVVLTNCTKADKQGCNRLIFHDSDDNKYEYIYNSKNQFCQDVFPFEYIPSIFREKKKLKIAFRVNHTKYNPIGSRYVFGISYPKFLGMVDESLKDGKEDVNG